jgi:dsDNA-specific endonuclease/ATPase MutS2
VRSLLKTSPYAGDFRPGEMGEGGDGVTIVLLR